MPKLTFRPTGQSPKWTGSRGLFFLLLVAILALSWGARSRTILDWDAQPQAFYSKEVPGSSSDSYYWFRIAREIRDSGAPLGERDPLRAWPEGLEPGPVPAFPWLIAVTSQAFGGDIYRAGIVLTVFISSLFIIPLALYLRRIGFPLAGLLGGFFGGLGHAYVQRTSAQRVDTDGGTLFFMALLALTIGSLRASASLGRNAFLAAAAGLSLAGFTFWYGQPWFWLIYVGTAGLHLICGSFPRRQVLWIASIFIVFANPLSIFPATEALTHFLYFYVLPSTETISGPFDYASITQSITELQPLPLSKTLEQVVDVSWVSALGLVGFFMFSLKHWRSAIPLLPIATLGLYALFGPRRFTLFLAPLVGIGWGFGLHILASSFRGSTLLDRRYADAATYLIAVAAGVLLLGNTGFAISPETGVRVPLIASLQNLRAVLPERAALLANWGRGYLLTDITGAATFSDGEAPDPLVHYLYARALTGKDPEELHRIVSALSTYGRTELHAMLDDQNDSSAAVEELLERPAATNGHVVLTLMEEDLVPFPAFFRTGQWDFAKRAGPVDGYRTLDCKQVAKQKLRCRDKAGSPVSIDLGKGMFEREMKSAQYLRRTLLVREGTVTSETDYARRAPLSLQLTPGKKVDDYTAHVVSERVFQSNFNQLYMLGRFDPTLFEEIHRTPSVLRAFRILP
jgi:undecaprenyl-diphosphooligosaccharide--protein glycosyltransferase